MNLYEFHPIALATCFLLYAMYFYKAEWPALFLLLLGLAMLCQENVALIAVAFAVYGLIDRRRGRWIWAPLAMGIFYFSIVVFFVMPRLNRNTIQFYLLYAPFGSSLPEIAWNIMAHPLNTLKVIGNPAKLAFLSSLVAPLGYLSMLSPVTFVPALPVLMQRLLSTRITETRMVFHYQAEFIPFVFVSAIFGIKKVLAWRHRIARPALVVIIIIFPVLALYMTGAVSRVVRSPGLSVQRSFVDTRKDVVLREIPRDACVMATFGFLPKLSSRSRLYSLHHVYSGYHTFSTVPYPIPGDVEYIVLDTHDALTFTKRGFYGVDNYRRGRRLGNQCLQTAAVNG